MSSHRNSWLDALPRYSLLRNDERKEHLRQKGMEVFDFGLGDPQEDTPAFIREALVKGITSSSQYPLAIGSRALRESCAQWALNRFGVTLCPAQEILSSNGSKESVFHIPHVLLNSSSVKRIVLIPDPFYPVYKSGTLLAGGIPVQIPLREDRQFVFDPDDVPAEILPHVAAVWVNYPHNPTGATITKAQMKRIYEWALENDIILLSDECYVDMFFEGTAAPHSFLEVAKDEKFKNLLAFFSLSKRSGMTGYRSGFVAGDAQLVNLFAKYRPNAGLATPDFVQAAAIAAWNDNSHVIERNRIFAEKRALIEEFYKKNNLNLLPTSATFYCWAKAPATHRTGEAFAENLAKNTGIVITPGDALGDSCTEWYRLALVPTAQRITQCLKLWQHAIDTGALSCK